MIKRKWNFVFLFGYWELHLNSPGSSSTVFDAESILRRLALMLKLKFKQSLLTRRSDC